jgi:hypothetical protein
MPDSSQHPVQTSASAYISDQFDAKPITFNVTQTIWDWNAWDIIHQTGNSHHITVGEAQDIIEALTEAITQLNK